MLYISLIEEKIQETLSSSQNVILFLNICNMADHVGPLTPGKQQGDAEDDPIFTFFHMTFM
jgi:hypothetical protein